MISKRCADLSLATGPLVELAPIRPGLKDRLASCFAFTD